MDNPTSDHKINLWTFQDIITILKWGSVFIDLNTAPNTENSSDTYNVTDEAMILYTKFFFACYSFTARMDQRSQILSVVINPTEIAQLIRWGETYAQRVSLDSCTETLLSLLRR